MIGRDMPDLRGGVPIMTISMAGIGIFDTRYDSNVPEDALPMTGRYSMMHAKWVGPEDGIVPVEMRFYMAAPDYLDCLPWPMMKVEVERAALPQELTNHLFFQRADAAFKRGGLIHA